MKYTFISIVFGLIFFAASVNAYTGCDDPTLDTGGKPCLEVTACGDPAGILDQANTYYLLMNDVSADNSCILINNNDITFDLNGHTITHAANPGPTPVSRGCLTYNSWQTGNICHHGISNVQGWISNGDCRNVPDWFHIPRIGCNNVEIKNGKVIQANDESPYTNNIALSGCTGYNLHDLQLHTIADDTMNIFGGAANAEIYDNNLTTDNRWVSNRHPILAQIDGVFNNGKIYGNRVIDSPQRGINAGGSDNLEIYNNYVSQDAIFTNNHGIGFYGGSNLYIHDNIIAPTYGRGIACEHVDGCWVYNNIVNVTEIPSPTEYPGQYGYCAHGIKLEGSTTNAHIYNNTVISYTGPGTQGTCALNVGIDGGAGTADIYNNTFIGYYAPNSVPSTYASAALIYGDHQNVNIHDNAFYSNQWFIYADGSVNGPLFENNMFVRTGPDLRPFHSVHYYGYHSNQLGLTLVNSTFVNAESDDIHIQDSYIYDWDYTVKWNLEVEVVDGSGQFLSPAIVEIRDADSNVAYTGTASGAPVVAELTQFYISGYSNTQQSRTDYIPYTVTVNYQGDIKSFEVNLVASQNLTVVYDYSGLSIDNLQCEINSANNWQACDQVGYGDVVLRMRVSCSDADGSVQNAYLSLTNNDDSRPYVSGTTTSGGLTYIYDVVPDITIEDSGSFIALARCTDNEGNFATKITDWNIPWGTLSVIHNAPGNPYNTVDGGQFTYRTTLTCNNGECGDVTATLDPFQDSGWVVKYQENFDNSMTAVNGQTFSTDGWLTWSLVNGGDITVQNGYAYVDTEDFENSAMIRSTSNLPEHFKVRAKIGYVNYDVTNYEQADFDNPNFNDHGGALENGIYFLTLADDTCSGNECAEDWWHWHRKTVIDVDDHYNDAAQTSRTTHPIYMVYMDQATNSQGNLLRTWDGSAWHTESWNWEVAYTYQPDTWYYAEIEKAYGKLILRLYDESQNLIEETSPIPIHKMNQWDSDTEILYIGEPHTDDYEGNARIDEITLLVPASEEGYYCGYNCYGSNGCTDYNAGPSCSINHQCDGSNVVDNIFVSSGQVVAPGTTINVGVDYDCWDSGTGSTDVVTIWYHNSESWRQIGRWTHQAGQLTGCDEISGDIDGTVITSLTLDNIIGQHTIRAIENDQDADWNEESAACPTTQNPASDYGDFDDLVLNVTTYASKGVVPQGSGTPFFTTSVNPQTCLGLKAADTCANEWTVKANIDQGAYEFFVIYNALNPMVAGAISPHIGVNVTEVLCPLRFDSPPDCDGCLNVIEVTSGINAWYFGSIPLPELIENLRIWKRGC